ncbi:LysM peptidoglycan-binding domain-containing protein [Phycicoccus endophyticus]|uniref:LysM peptidoglycan-binding domain-containing protein n=1 Tax=Phycicoccus endophyticus TaxID=1690220 RepID=A0A7G9R588_9MICO|nr:LysM peptidoglycan-binding domain-containing protein [Phycicoccus endophyticus]NHI20631.1 LysM peptidoglycan-binding domain-containing protein [Phycicoccus endophyticus]QNN50763.1 LysM peptidoglycan-binding domain-containing protein [Phycicoccus endophyticus]
MSAIAWEPAEAGSCTPAGAGRPALVLLPGGAGRPQAARGGLRLTARGRLVLLVLGVVVLAGLLGVRGLGGAGAAEPAHTVTVEAGQTLSEVAAAELPQMTLSDGIVAIQLANDLSTAQVSAGQELVIPAR